MPNMAGLGLQPNMAGLGLQPNPMNGLDIF